MGMSVYNIMIIKILPLNQVVNMNCSLVLFYDESQRFSKYVVVYLSNLHVTSMKNIQWQNYRGFPQKRLAMQYVLQSNSSYIFVFVSFSSPISYILVFSPGSFVVSLWVIVCLGRKHCTTKYRKRNTTDSPLTVKNIVLIPCFSTIKPAVMPPIPLPNPKCNPWMVPWIVPCIAAGVFALP